MNFKSGEGTVWSKYMYNFLCNTKQDIDIRYFWMKDRHSCADSDLIFCDVTHR